MKHESPPFKMMIEGGKLVPATAYDAERLDTYRRGTKVNVVMVRDGGRIMERKWFAVLGLVVKQCNVPWKNKDQASEAVKLALGIVNLSKTIGGEFMAYPKSLTELTDPELDEAVRDMMDLIQKMTGIDPATLKKEIADVGEDDQEPVDGSSADGTGSGETVPSSPAVDASLSQESGKEAGDPEAADGQSAAPASVSLSPDDKAFLVRVFKTMKAAVGPEVNVFKRQALVFTDEIGGKSDLVRAKAKTIRERLQECCGDAPAKGTVEVGRYLAGVIGVDERELVD
ncbi:hypothetical protein [Mesorhizobium sp. B2-1-3A]|uniref:hypothetical protein n=1 Tax=Mesorhizobium sp. B2-1-3A TaxID=2589971 RepID=UPI00112810A5|nr:hypothetical protein [Mesorhizobium sp. B2-1-3A]TPM89831.1 hypothetical protein FJ977_35200 [Mesorhizobium sp. B2-1-3A]